MLNEGGLSLILASEETTLCEMSFSWVDAALFGRPECGVVPFITRNQSSRPHNAALAEFRQAFPHNSPAYFFFAAMHGVALAHRKSFIAGIRQNCQPSFRKIYQESFRKSYGEFWSSFDGIEADPQSYLMPVPLTLAPIAELQSRHRHRAQARRRNWADIADGAMAAILVHKQ